MMSSNYNANIPYLPFGMEEQIVKAPHIQEKHTALGTEYNFDIIAKMSRGHRVERTVLFSYMFEINTPKTSINDHGVPIHKEFVITLSANDHIVQRTLLSYVAVGDIKPENKVPMLEEAFFEPDESQSKVVVDETKFWALKPQLVFGSEVTLHKVIKLDRIDNPMGYHFNFTDLHIDPNTSAPALEGVPFLCHPMDMFVQWGRKTDMYSCQLQMFKGVDKITAFMLRAIEYVKLIHLGKITPYLNEISICVNKFGADETIRRLKAIIDIIAAKAKPIPVN